MRQKCGYRYKKGTMKTFTNKSILDFFVFLLDSLDPYMIEITENGQTKFMIKGKVNLAIIRHEKTYS